MVLTIVSKMETTQLGERIKHLRELRGWSQRQLAERAGVGSGLVSLLEAGKRARPGYDTLNKLATALGVTAAMLMGSTEAGPDPAEINREQMVEYFSRALTNVEPQRARAFIEKIMQMGPEDVQFMLEFFERAAIGERIKPVGREQPRKIVEPPLG